MKTKKNLIVRIHNNIKPDFAAQATNLQSVPNVWELHQLLGEKLETL